VIHEVALWASHGDSVEVWYRRRPEWWWGIFWLKEFWATVIFGVLLTLSLWRDRKYFCALDARVAAKLATKAPPPTSSAVLP
jgi:hypothetical protein